MIILLDNAREYNNITNDDLYISISIEEEGRTLSHE